MSVVITRDRGVLYARCIGIRRLGVGIDIILIWSRACLHLWAISGSGKQRFVRIWQFCEVYINSDQI